MTKENRMKKALAYTATAILLGFAIMMLPLALKTGPSTYQPKPQFMSTPSEGGDMKGEDNSLARSFGLAGQPSNLLSSSLIFFSGLMIALGIYIITKRRIIY